MKHLKEIILYTIPISIGGLCLSAFMGLPVPDPVWMGGFVLSIAYVLVRALLWIVDRVEELGDWF